VQALGGPLPTTRSSRLAERAVASTWPRDAQARERRSTPPRVRRRAVAGRARVSAWRQTGDACPIETAEPGEPTRRTRTSLLRVGRYPFNIDAVTSGTIAWLPRQALFALLDLEPGVARDLVSTSPGRVVHFTSVVQSLTLDVPSRLARYLFQRALSDRPHHAGRAQ